MNVQIFYGGLSGFRKVLPKGSYTSIIDLAILDDARRRNIKVEINGQETENETIEEYENIVAFSDDYPSLSEGTIESFTNLILRFNIKNLYLQNAPDSIIKYLEEMSFAHCKRTSQKYKTINMNLLKKINSDFSKNVIGQENAQHRIVAALYNVAKKRYNKPCVMLFYGSTGVGKTESAKYIANTLKETLFRKQFSMLHSDEFSSYIFGGKHNQKSLAKDLLERESNVILFDEFDKPHPVFHSAFYQLFDEGIYADKNYTVKMNDSIIICTSNYMSEKEIKSALGEPIFSRFDVIVKFEKLNETSISKIMEVEFQKQYSVLDKNEKEIVEKCQIKKRVFSLINQLDNARQIRKIIREAISAALIKEIL